MKISPLVTILKMITKSFNFIDTELRNFTSKNIKLLISKNANHDLVAKIENELYNAIDNIDKLR